MEERITPEESLLLISKTIEATKQRFQESGHLLVLWGVITIIVFGSQYVLVALDLYKEFDIIWTTALFPLGAIYTFIYVRKIGKKRHLPRTFISRTMETMGWTLGANLLILGFFFRDQLGIATAPIFLILFALFMITAGTSIKFKPLLIGGVLVNVIAFGTFFLNPDYHGYSMMLGSLVGLVIPGILLNKNRKENV